MKLNEQQEARVQNDRCAVCPGELDTGFECNECGFDARDYATKIPPINSAERKAWLDLL